MGLNLSVITENDFYTIKELTHDFVCIYRLYRRKWSCFKQKKNKQKFTKILFITKDLPPKEYILKFQKQYPEKEFLVLIPILKEDKEYKKINKPIEFFANNTYNTAYLYKLPHQTDNIKIYGIYSDIFLNAKNKDDFNNIIFSAPFIKCANIVVNRLGIDIVHADKIPYFLGYENLTNKKPRLKVFQIVDDFKLTEYETFWLAINSCDEKNIKKICKDKYIKKYLSQLFDIPIKRMDKNMNECLRTIYKNYMQFRDGVSENDTIHENNVFKRLNARTAKLFPEFSIGDGQHSNPMFYSVKKSDEWGVLSKTYYDFLYNTNVLSENEKKCIDDKKEKCICLNGLINENSSHENKIIYKYNTENFREYKPKNKRYLIKEFAEKRISTKFIDRSLFKEKNPLIHGFLNPFFDFPLILCSLPLGTDDRSIICVINSLLKMFELNKNFLVIINIPQGLRNRFVKSFIDFCKQYSEINGRWVYINEELNLSQFYAGSDIMLFPMLTNDKYEFVLNSLKYGCIPITFNYGIYNDIISDIFQDLNFGCGFKAEYKQNFKENYENLLSNVINHYGESAWNVIIKNAMKRDNNLNFEKIEKYNSVYEELKK